MFKCSDGSPSLFLLSGHSLKPMPTNALELVKLTSLMERTSGRPEVKIGLIDGPVDGQHPDLAVGRLQEIGGKGGTCVRPDSVACLHGTYVAGILCAKRDSYAPAICPGCTLLIRSIFSEVYNENQQVLSATPEELASAITESVAAGVQVLNLSLALSPVSSKRERVLCDVLDHAARRGVLVVAAAGNQGVLGSSVITRHQWVIPVAACNLAGRPTKDSNLGRSIGTRGVSAPGDGITSIGPDGPITLGGTSVAVPFVTGTIALLWSEFPAATAEQIKLAIRQASASHRPGVVPPLLNASITRQILLSTISRGQKHEKTSGVYSSKSR